MLDVRTHGKIFRPFVAQEQRWLMKWGSSKFEDMRGNCHIFRSLAKWGGAEGRSQSKIQKNRNEKIKQKRRAKRRKKLKERRKDRGHTDYIRHLIRLLRLTQPFYVIERIVSLSYPPQLFCKVACIEIYLFL